MDSERLRNEVDSMLALFERLGECDRRLHELLATTSEAPSIRDVSEKRDPTPAEEAARGGATRTRRPR